MSKELLTQAEVDALPTGAKVWIKWSGGNGPHLYGVINHNGEAWTAWPGGKLNCRIDFVGEERFHTQVIFSTTK